LDKAPEAFRTISEVAEDLDVPQHVLRFWESRFVQIKPMKRGGGRRYYRPEDIDLLRGIRFLLYGEGYTIRGVQRILRGQGVRFVQSVWQEGAKQLQLRQVAATADDDEIEEDTPQRGRSMFGLLAKFQGREHQQEDHEDEQDDDSEDDEEDDDDSASTDREERPVLNPAPLRLASDPLPEVTPRVVKPASAGLAREDLRRLQATLKDLNECRRLLDAALKQDDT
jgi:DNA-binding transcriptional MerR regulator